MPVLAAGHLQAPWVDDSQCPWSQHRQRGPLQCAGSSSVLWTEMEINETWFCIDFRLLKNNLA